MLFKIRDACYDMTKLKTPALNGRVFAFTRNQHQAWKNYIIEAYTKIC